jgi:hypothetical protein
LFHQLDEEFVLKVYKLIEPQEEAVNRILIVRVLLHERTGVVLLIQKGSVSETTDLEFGAYLHDFHVLDILSFSINDFAQRTDADGFHATLF